MAKDLRKRSLSIIICISDIRSSSVDHFCLWMKMIKYKLKFRRINNDHRSNHHQLPHALHFAHFSTLFSVLLYHLFVSIIFALQGRKSSFGSSSSFSDSALREKYWKHKPKSLEFEHWMFGCVRGYLHCYHEPVRGNSYLNEYQQCWLQ